MKKRISNKKGCSGFLNTNQYSRRQAISFGVCGGLGLSMGQLLRAEAATNKKAPAKSIIQLHLPGGMAQQESFDPKPEASVEYRGSFGVEKTKTGEYISENFPKTAAVTDKLTLIRSIVGKIPDHALATYHLFTGYTPTAVIDYPQMGAVLSHELGANGILPPYMCVPNNNSMAGGSGFLSSKYGTFELGSEPNRQGINVKDFSIPEGVSLDRFDRRMAARDIIEKRMRALETDTDKLNTMDDFYKQSYKLLTSPEARQAFTFKDEKESTFKLYGSDVVGLKGPDNKYHPKGLAEKLILARRLVEAGVRFVQVNYGDWDSHVDIRRNCLDYMPALDHGIAGLITDLDQRGLLDSTIFWVTSEMGRTPKVNDTSGRDHWSRVYSMLIAGGGFAKGLTYGASDATAAEPSRNALPLNDLQYTIYNQLGIDANKRLLAFGTRPIDIIKGGKLAKGLLG